MASAFQLRAHGTRQALDMHEVRLAFAFLPDPDHGIELRGIPEGRSRVLRGDDIDGLCDAAEDLADCQFLYYCLNPIPTDAPRAKSACVIKRRWILFDVDPVRQEGFMDSSSTEDEKAVACSVAARINDHMTLIGWPVPVSIDSGNGYHLMYRIDIPNDERSKALVKKILYNVAEKFDTPQAKVDRSVHDAPRICKLPGSWARKGKATEDRPHRICRVIHTPAEVQVVSEELLNRAAGVVGEKAPPPQHSSTNGDGKPFVLHGDAERYANRALENEVLRVESAGADGRNNALNRAAFSLGQLVAGGALDRTRVEQALREAANRAGLDSDPGCGERGIEATIRSGIEAGMQEPRVPPEKPAAKTDPKTDPKKLSGLNWQFRMDGSVLAEGTPKELVHTDNDDSEIGPEIFDIYSLPTILEAEFPTPNWVVPGILSEGLNILAGKPKIGKSMLALNLAMTVAGGGMALQEIKTVPGDVMYLCLEDKNRRVQSRARVCVKGLVGCGISSRLQIATRWPNQESGGIQLLDIWVKSVARPTLVIIDVWGLFRPAYKNGSQYEQDYQHMSAVKKFVDKRSCSALILHHCRKGPSEDALEEVSGTMGLTGVADGVLVLSKSRNDNEAKIFVTGRDVQEQELALEFVPETLTWKSLGSAEQHIQGKLQLAIIAYLKSLRGTPAFATDIAHHLNMDEKDNSVRKVLSRLFEKGLVRRHGKAWAYPGEDGEPEPEPCQNDEAEV